MKKKFRGAAGQGPKGHSAKHSGKQGDSGGARGDNRNRDDAAAAKSGKQTGRRSGGGRGDNDAGGEPLQTGARKSRHKKPIKNARSLSDVLGMTKPGAGSSPAPRGNFRSPRGGGESVGRGGRDAESTKRGGTSGPARGASFRPSSRPEPKSAEKVEPPAKPKTSKLQYIMNFIMPGSAGRAAEAEAKKATAAKATADTAAAKAAQNARANSRPTANRGASNDRNSRNQGRQSAPSTSSTESRSGSRRGQPDRSAGSQGRGSGRAESRNPNADIVEKFDARADARPSRSRQKSSQKKASKGPGGAANPLIQGFVKRHPDGYGFLIPDDRTIPDVYIARQWMNGVMTNDRVEAEIYQNRDGQNRSDQKQSRGGDKPSDRLFGEVKTILSHATQRIVGKYLPVDLRYGVILDEDHGWGTDLRIQAQDTMGAVEGDMVAVQILQYPGPDQEFLGKVIERIGDLDDPINDVKRVIYSKNIPEEFSAKALADARKFGGVVTEPEIKDREDLRALNLITIDGATARDFDDAVFVEKSGTGFHLVVAIADVSHYVKPQLTLDEEAYERGTSTYFPNYVVPMLPEELSNELCSLKPHVTRLCFVCDMKINFNGEIESSRFYEGVMESKARVTYGEAQEVLDGSTPGKLTHVRDNIILAADLAKILMAKRMREGSLDLEIPETQVVVDKSGETVDIIKSERLFAHRLIEELMLVTNISTAKFFDEHQIEGIYRIHEPPNEENIATLQRYLWNFGGQKTMGEGKLQKKLTRALESMHGLPGAQVLNILTLRSMNQAKYSSGNVGHFGLGFDHYSHFTSPIRRYPDLIAHRLIKSVLYPKYKYMRMTDADLQTAATMLSACEQRSVKAERMLISIKKARFMKKYVGEEFEGVISSVAKFGIFVLLRQFDADGLVKIEALGNDRFVYDEENLKLVGKRTGLAYTIGDDIRIRVAGADTEFGKIDFELASSPPKSAPGTEEGDDRDDAADDNNPSSDEKKGSRRERAQKSEPKRSTGKPQAKLGRRTEQQAASGPGKEGRASKRSKNRGNSQKRGKAQDDSGGVRQERVSKSRRKD